MSPRQRKDKYQKMESAAVKHAKLLAATFEA
jgi:hypothetical protein